MDRSLPDENDEEEYEDDGSASAADERQPGLLDHDYKPSRRTLVLTLAPLVMIPVIGNISLLLFRPVLIAHHPAVLLAISPSALYMASASVHTGIVTFFTVVILRSVLFDPCYFLIGRWYGDAALVWMEKQSPSSTKWMRRVEQWFPRFGPLLIAFYPAALVMIMAGASRMKLWAYMAYDIAGTLIISIAIWRAGQSSLSSPIKSVNAFFGRYWWQIIVVSIVYALIMSIRAQIKDGKQALPSIEDLADDLEAEEEAEEAAHRHPKAD